VSISADIPEQEPLRSLLSHKRVPFIVVVISLCKHYDTFHLHCYVTDTPYNQPVCWESL